MLRRLMPAGARTRATRVLSAFLKTRQGRLSVAIVIVLVALGACGGKDKKPTAQQSSAPPPPTTAPPRPHPSRRRRRSPRPPRRARRRAPPPRPRRGRAGRAAPAGAGRRDRRRSAPWPSCSTPRNPCSAAPRTGPSGGYTKTSAANPVPASASVAVPATRYCTTVFMRARTSSSSGSTASGGRAERARPCRMEPEPKDAMTANWSFAFTSVRADDASTGAAMASITSR